MTPPDDIVIEQGSWQALGQQASEVRQRVFVEEQHVPEGEEWDGLDSACHHFLALNAGQAVGTARLLPDGHIGRVAVLASARGRNIGLCLMQAAIDTARRQGHRSVALSAQTHALAFYEKLGFKAYGGEFLDAGIPHRNMKLDLAD